MIRHGHFVYRKEAEEGEDGGGGKADTEIDDEAKGGEPEPKEPEVSAEVIAKAEKMGWTPKDQFKGDPAKWRPADEFVARGENMLPLVKAQVKRQEREIAELKSAMKEFGEFHSKTAQREYQRALDSLRQQRADAIAKADGVAFDKVDAEIDALKEKVTQTGKPQQQEEGFIPAAQFNEWLSRNSWANDPKLQAYGTAVRDELHRENPGVEGIELLDLVTKEVKQRFPERFENPRRNSAPSVEGGAGPRKSGGKSFADMPADARAACERMAKNGYADKPKEAAAFKAEYVKTYFSEGA